MDFTGFAESIVSFGTTNTVIVIVPVVGLLLFLCRKPKLFLTLLFLGLFLGGLYYLVMNMAGSSSEQKKRLLHKADMESDSIH